jgi:hypothetical protein
MIYNIRRTLNAREFELRKIKEEYNTMYLKRKTITNGHSN